MSTLWSPCRSKNRSMVASPVFEHSFSTASRPSDRAIQKQAATTTTAMAIRDTQALRLEATYSYLEKLGFGCAGPSLHTALEGEHIVHVRADDGKHGSVEKVGVRASRSNDADLPGI